jgi:hypothetical protein
MLGTVLKAVAGITGLHATACVLMGAALLFGSCSERSSFGVAGVALGCVLLGLGYLGAFAAGALWALEERGRRATVAFTLALVVIGIGCALSQWRFSFAGVAWQAVVLAVVLLPASRRACSPGRAASLNGAA